MEFLEKKLRIPVVSFFVKPIESKGVPSMPFAFLTVLGFLVLAWIFFPMFFSLTNSIDFRVSVLDEEEKPVPAASVEVYIGGELVASGLSEENGSVILRVPRERVLLKVSATGFSEARANADLNLVSKAVVKLSRSIGAGNILISLSVLEEESGKGVENAEVQYRANVEGKVFTNSRGVASFSVPDSSAVDLKISKEGFRTNVLRIIASVEKFTVKLKKAIDSRGVFENNSREGQRERNVFDENRKRFCELNPLAIGCREDSSRQNRVFFSTEGNAVVYVYDERGQPVSRGVASILDADTYVVLGRDNFSNGFVAFGGLQIGSNAFVSVTAPGFKPFVGRSEAQRVVEYTVFSVVLQRLEEGERISQGIVTTKDEAGNLIPATLMLFRKPDFDTVILSVESQGVFSFDLSSLEEYYIVASAPGRISGEGDLRAGSSLNLTLVRASESNSGKIRVLVRNEDQESLSGANVAVFEELSSGRKLFLAGGQSDSLGRKEFENLAFGKNYSILVSYFGESGSKNIVLERDAILEFVLEVNTGFIEVIGRNAVNNREVNASYSLYHEGMLYSSCIGLSCSLKAKTSSLANIEGRNESFLPFSTVSSINPRQRKEIIAYFVPRQVTEFVSIRFKGVFDENGGLVNLLEAGKTYKIVLEVTVPGDAEKSGVFLRIGSRQSVEVEDAGIMDVFEETDFLSKSVSYTPQPVCRDANNFEARDGLLKWVEIGYNRGYSKEYTFFIKIKENAVGGSLLIHYRGFAVRNNIYIRDPVDSVLGSGETASNKAGCYAETYSNSFLVTTRASSQPTPSPTSTPSPSPSPNVLLQQQCTNNQDCSAGMNCIQGTCVMPQVTGDFTPEISIWFDAAANEIKSSTDLIILQADPVFPADAIPVRMESVMGCQLKSFNKIIEKGPNAACYLYDASKNILKFVSKEANANCPIHVVGNKLVDGEEREVKEDYSAEFSVQCNEEINKTISIKLITKTTGSLAWSPIQLSEGPNTAKLVYLINQNQFKYRWLKLVSGETQPIIQISATDINPIAWLPRSPSLSLFEKTDSGKEEFMWEWTYSTAPSYFAGIGDLGSRINECRDYLCCLQGWCTGKAFSEAKNAFEQTARQIASQTAFRRGNGQPLKNLEITNSFVFTTGAQLIEGLSPENFGIQTKRLPNACRTGNPGVYKIKLKTTDGASWNYEAEIAELSLSSYVSANGPAMPLCNFLFGTDGGQQTTQPGASPSPIPPIYYDEEGAPTVAHNQLANPSLIPVPSWFFGIIPAAEKCKKLNEEYKKEKQNTENECSKTIWYSDAYPISQEGSCNLLLNNVCTPTSCFSRSSFEVNLENTLNIINSLKECEEKTNPIDSCRTEVQKAVSEEISKAETKINTAKRECENNCLTTAQQSASQCTSCNNYPCPTLDNCLRECRERAETAKNTAREEINKCNATAFKEIAAGSACEKAVAVVPDLPGLIPKRDAWLTCYPYSDSCHLRCSEKRAIIVIVPVKNQIFEVLHFGLNPDCSFKQLNLFQIFLALSPNLLYKQLGREGSASASMLIGLFGVQDLVFYPDPFSALLMGAPHGKISVPPKPLASMEETISRTGDNPDTPDYLRLVQQAGMGLNGLTNYFGGIIPSVAGMTSVTQVPIPSPSPSSSPSPSPSG